MEGWKDKLSNLQFHFDICLNEIRLGKLFPSSNQNNEEIQRKGQINDLLSQILMLLSTSIVILDCDVLITTPHVATIHPPPPQGQK